MLIWILLTVLYYFFLLYPLFRYRAFDGIVAKKANGILTLFVYFAVGVLIYTAISKERFIYYWDYGGYYDRTIFIKNMYMNLQHYLIMEHGFRQLWHFLCD